MHRFPLPTLLVVGVLVSGCSKKPDSLVKAESLDPEAIAKQILERYDRNGDGKLERDEIDDSPPLKHAFHFIDRNKDRSITLEELTQRFQMYSGTTVPLGCSVTIAGQPAPNCKITLTPDPMFKHLTPVSGTTNEMGFAEMKVDGKDSRGVPAGWYTVSITDASGVELTRDKVGREVLDDGRDNRDILIFAY